MSKSISTDISRVQIELWDVADIKPYPFNNKKHPEKHIELLMRSIKVQGHLDPLILDKDGVIISGHGRFEALKRLGREKVAVRVLKDISEPEAAALRIAANKTVSNDYDTDILGRELSRLAAESEMDLSVLGFDERELTMLITDIGEIDEDAFVEDMDKAVGDYEADISEHTAEIDAKTVRLDDALGFKHIPLRDQRTVTRFMAEIEAKTGKMGAEALLEHMQDVVRAA